MPPATAEAIKRLKTLVVALTQQTSAGRIEWKDKSPSNSMIAALADGEVFSVSLPRSTITVRSRPGITVTDQNGEVLQEYLPSMMDVVARDSDLERLLKALLDEIREEQRRALGALDDIIADVRRLGESD